MDTLLVAVTLISLTLAGALALLLTKLLRDERRRSDARVAALVQLAEEQATPRGNELVLLREPASLRLRAEAPEMKRNGARAEDARAARTRSATAPGDLELRPASAAAAAPDLFATPEQASPWGRRLSVIGVMAFVAGAALFALVNMRGGAARAEAPAATRAAVDGTAPPLELVSLRYTQQGDSLLITGLVQNPKTGRPLTRLVATAVVFGPDGTFLAGGRAPLDYTTLGAGDESPFVISVPVKGTVSRYRVGFRAEDGSVVAHVDRRISETASRTGT